MNEEKMQETIKNIKSDSRNPVYAARFLITLVDCWTTEAAVILTTDNREEAWEFVARLALYSEAFHGA